MQESANNVKWDKFIMSGVYRFSEKAYVTNICTTATMYKS